MNVLALVCFSAAAGAYVAPLHASLQQSRRTATVVMQEAPPAAADFETPKRSLPKRRGRAKRTERKAPVSAKGFGTTGSGLKFSRAPKLASDCACNSGLRYGECCHHAHENGHAADALTLLRARYSAFRYRLPDFLMSTTKKGSPEWQVRDCLPHGLASLSDSRGGLVHRRTPPRGKSRCWLSATVLSSRA